MSKTRKPTLLYRLSKDSEYLYLRVPDDDLESESVLMFNRLMADLGFPEPSAIWNKRLGVAVVPPFTRYVSNGRLVTRDLLSELGDFFSMRPIKDIDWYTTRF